jgi:hypothetical protein
MIFSPTNPNLLLVAPTTRFLIRYEVFEDTDAAIAELLARVGFRPVGRFS